MNKFISKYKVHKVQPIINCDGYYPQCPSCYYFDLKINENCPQCGQEIDWDFLNIKKEDDIDK